MKNRLAFTMIELIFVIVIMGIIGKFGVEFLAQAYKSFIFSSINNSLQQNSATAVEFIASRLQYRIKDSAIARVSATSTPIALGSAAGKSFTILEWVNGDIDGFRGNSSGATPYQPNWSGIIDLDGSVSNATNLASPSTNTDNINTLIDTLSYGDSTIADAALYFIGSNSDVLNGYGWDSNLTNITAQKGTIHPINSVTSQPTKFTSSTGTSFSGVDIYEYYKLVWTANAIVYTPGTNSKGTLTYYYDYQPWKNNGSGTGEVYTDGKSAIIMKNVSTFRFISIDSIVKIQVCVKNDIQEKYSLCKEKTIF